MIRSQNIVTVVKLEILSTPNPPPNQRLPSSPPTQTARLLLSVSKPSWIVRTESNVLKEAREKPDPPCVICYGSGRVDCHICHGKGRINHTHLAMLPKGEWPKWCRTCGGSGLSYCSRCVGTGEYRYIMGFQFMKKSDTDYQYPNTTKPHHKQPPKSPAADEQLDSST